MTELTEDFLKLLQIAIVIEGILAVFLIYIQYNITLQYNAAERKAILLGDSLLSNTCLTETSDDKPVRGVFLESKLNSLVSDSSCFKQSDFRMIVELVDNSRIWNIYTGTPFGASATYYVAVKSNNDVKF